MFAYDGSRETEVHELRQAIPDPSIIPLLPSEELASAILFILRKRMESNNGQPFLLYNELLILWPQQHSPMEIVLLANHLIRIVEARRKAMQP